LFCNSRPENHKLCIAHRPIRFLVGVRFGLLQLLARKSHAYASQTKIGKTEQRVGRRRVPLIPFCWTISISNVSSRTPTLDKIVNHQFYSSQTKMLENETAGRACLFEALCEGVSTRFGLQILAKCIEKTRPTCCFVFQHRRLGSINSC